MAATPQDQQDIERERLLRVLSAATFVIFFQAFMVAPIIPMLATAFEVSPQNAGLIVPAYLVPMGPPRWSTACWLTVTGSGAS